MSQHETTKMPLLWQEFDEEIGDLDPPVSPGGGKGLAHAWSDGVNAAQEAVKRVMLRNGMI